MQWSNDRILTTHTGSLPRPPELTRLYVRRARGEAVDPAEIERLGKAALSRIVDKQIEARVDVGAVVITATRAAGGAGAHEGESKNRNQKALFTHEDSSFLWGRTAS